MGKHVHFTAEVSSATREPSWLQPAASSMSTEEQPALSGQLSAKVPALATSEPLWLQEASTNLASTKTSELKVTFESGSIGAALFSSAQGVVLKDVEVGSQAAKLNVPNRSVILTIGGISVAGMEGNAVVAMLADASRPVELTLMPAPSES